MPASVVFWTDPTCPWAWQTSKWIRTVRDAGLVDVEWRVFSLELLAASQMSESGADEPFATVTPRGGEALRALLLARSEGGNDGFDEFYRSIGRVVHEDRAKISPELVRRAALDVGSGDLIDRAVAEQRWADQVRAEHEQIRDRGAFGVPTISIDGAVPIFGPVFGVAPTGDRAVAAFEHTRWLAGQPEFYELKRVRPARPGEMPGSVP